MIQVWSFAHVQTRTIPESLPHFQQLNAATIPGFPKGSLGDTLFRGPAWDRRAHATRFGYLIDYAGQSRQYMTVWRKLLALTMVLATIIIFLALAALFESFRDPFIILISVPLSIAGALISINLGVGDASLNIYTKIGILTLAGLISETWHPHRRCGEPFAEAKGTTKREAVEIAAGMRLRPILMTTAAMVLGVVPLLFKPRRGRGGVAFNMGPVVASAPVRSAHSSRSFVVLAVYTFLAEDHHRLRERQQAQEALIEEEHEPAE